MSKSNRLQFYPGKNGRIYWRAVSPNGKVVADCSEGDGYRNQRNAEKGARAAAKILILALGP